MEIYRVMDRHGKVLDESQDPNLGQDMVTRMYTTMIQLQAMDNVLYEAQRQGRISFYMTNYGYVSQYMRKTLTVAWVCLEQTFRICTDSRSM